MNRTVKIWLTCFLLGFGTLGLGQNPDIKRTWHWYFGWGAGLDFSNGSPVAVTGAMHSWEGISSISDTNGNLLFYTDGDTIWDRTHTPMPNGAGLLNCSENSSSQGALIVPQPESDSLYYLFTTDCGWGINGFRYTVIDMSLNSGLGDVAMANQVLIPAPNSTEKVAAVHHANGCDIWVLAQHMNKYFYLYLLTATGLDTVPIIQNSGIKGSIFGQPQGDTYLKFSPNGQYIANEYHYNIVDTLVVYDFDNSTGSISNPLAIEHTAEEVAGLSFSPDNSKLYTAGAGAYGWPTERLYQYDITSGTVSGIMASKTLIYQQDSIALYGMQIGPDNKIYIATFDWSGNGNFDSVSVIHNPNAAGLGCNFEHNAIYLNGGMCIGGMPNFVESYFNPLLTTCNTAIAETTHQHSYNVYPNPASEHVFVETNTAEPYNVHIYDLLGKEVFNRNNISGKRIKINTNRIIGNAFILRITDESTSANVKLLKL